MTSKARSLAVRAVMTFATVFSTPQIFRRSRNAAIARLRDAGAVFLSYKTLYYELIQTVGGSRHADAMIASFGPFPDDLPDQAV